MASFVAADINNSFLSHNIVNRSGPNMMNKLNTWVRQGQTKWHITESSVN